MLLVVLLMLAASPVAIHHGDHASAAAVAAPATETPPKTAEAAVPAVPAKVEAAEATPPDAKPGVITSDSGDFQYEEAALPPTLPELGKLGAAQDGKPKIAIVIDDMGVDVKHSARAIHDLPASITLSFLPYSPNIAGQTRAAYDLGHELLVHMPMEAIRGTVDPGPDALSTSLSDAEIAARTEKNLDAFSGYVGVNNHMGSKFTQDRHRLGVVMDKLAARHLFFLDSVTVAQSVAESVAKDHHLQASHRDVFIDHFESPELVEQSLKRIEYVAKHGGTAIAIGHPKDVTIDALEKWLPTLKSKGFELVPLSEIIDQRAAIPGAAVAHLDASIAAPAAAPTAEEAGGPTYNN